MWISLNQCSFPGNKWRTKLQNLLVAIKMCASGERVFFLQVFIKGKKGLQNLTRCLIYIKWEVEEMKSVLQPAALNSHKNLISSQTKPGYFAFWLLQMKFAIAYYCWGSWQEMAFPSGPAFQAPLEASWGGLELILLETQQGFLAPSVALQSVPHPVLV